MNYNRLQMKGFAQIKLQGVQIINGILFAIQLKINFILKHISISDFVAAILNIEVYKIIANNKNLLII